MKTTKEQRAQLLKVGMKVAPRGLVVGMIYDVNELLDELSVCVDELTEACGGDMELIEKWNALLKEQR